MSDQKIRCEYEQKENRKKKREQNALFFLLSQTSEAWTLAGPWPVVWTLGGPWPVVWTLAGPWPVVPPVLHSPAPPNFGQSWGTVQRLKVHQGYHVWYAGMQEVCRGMQLVCSWCVKMIES